MVTYLLMFLFFGMLAYMSEFRQSAGAKNFQLLTWNPMWLAIFFFLTIFIGLRHEVGGDWGSYLIYVNSLKDTKISDGFSLTSDPGYLLLNWYAANNGFSIYFVNFIAAIIFSLGLVIFCRNLPRPLLALVAAIPYLIIVVSMGYTRQGIALGIAMMGLVLLGREKRYWFILFILFATSFHKSAIMLLPIAALAATKNRFFIIFWISMIGLAAYYSALSSQFERLVTFYIQETYESQGALVRLFMLLIPSLLLILWPHRFSLEYSELLLWKVFAGVSLSLFILYFFTDASTAIDRMALYLLPIQLVVFSYLPEFFGKSGQQRQWIILGIIIYFFLVLIVWINYSPWSVYWIPYESLLLNWQ